MTKRGRRVAVSFAAIVVTLLVFENSDSDRAIQALLYNADSGQWLLNRHAPLARLIFYDGAKMLLIGYAVGLAVALACSYRLAPLAVRRRGIVLALLAILVVPAVVGGLKATTNTACPRALQDYGGAYVYVRLFQAWPVRSTPARRQRCFPAGHASGGFALMALVFVCRRRQTRRTALLGGLVAGWSMGLYKMAIGDHFLSHTIITMLIAIHIVLWLDWLLPRPPPSVANNEDAAREHA